MTFAVRWAAYVATIVSLALSGCVNGIDRVKQKEMDEFNERLFSKTIIDSRSILDSLGILADKVCPDTASYLRTPKATLFVNTAAFTKDQVFEDPKGVITAIAYYREGKEINVAEYFSNGHVICQFSVTHDGIRDGDYQCFYESGKLKRFGAYRNGQIVKDSALAEENQAL